MIFANTILYYNHIFSKKKCKNLKIFIFIILLLLFSVSCKKINILAPTYIPQNSKFPSPPKDGNIEDANIEINPKPAQDGEVFGSFQRKFRYKNKWYIMAGDIYQYNADTKNITLKGNNALLELDDNGNLIVYSKNVDYKIWQHLHNMNIINENQVWYQDEGIQNGMGTYSLEIDNRKIGNAPHSFQIAVYSNNLSYHSSDLLNWNTRGKIDNIAMRFPSGSPFPFNNAWYPGYYDEFHNVYFKGKLYVLGGGQSWAGSPNNRNFKKLKVIDWGKDGYNSGNWNYFDYPWGDSSCISVYMDEEKLYVQQTGNYWWRFLYNRDDTDYYTPAYNHFVGNIYSTTGKIIIKTNISYNYVYDRDGNVKGTITNESYVTNIEWKQENFTSDLYNKEVYTYQHYLAGPKINPYPRTPNPPDWIKDIDKEIYYKTASSYGKTYFNGKYYYLPIPPHQEIYKAAYNGETNFTVSEEHLKNLGKNQFMASLVNPANAKEEDWKLISPLKYTGHSLVWQIGAENMLFNLSGGKMIQLMDYSKMEDFANNNYNSIINELRKEAKKYREYAENSTYSSYGEYYQAMYYEAQADILEAIIKNTTIEVIKPDEAMTHYEIDFMYN